MTETKEARATRQKAYDVQDMFESMVDFADVLTQTKYALAAAKLDQFRRHPDYGRALRKVFDTADDLKMTPDGEPLGGILDKHLLEWQNRADQEFIDEIIRNGG